MRKMFDRDFAVFLLSLTTIFLTVLLNKLFVFNMFEEPLNLICIVALYFFAKEVVSASIGQKKMSERR